MNEYSNSNSVLEPRAPIGDVIDSNLPVSSEVCRSHEARALQDRQQGSTSIIPIPALDRCNLWQRDRAWFGVENLSNEQIKVIFRNSLNAAWEAVIRWVDRDGKTLEQVITPISRAGSAAIGIITIRA